MRQFIQIENNQPIKYPISATQVYLFAPEGTGFPFDCTGANLEEFGFYTLAGSPQPSIDPATQRVIEATPVLIDGEWTQQWSVDAYAPPPAPVPQSISDRQFAQALAIGGLITKDAALAWVKVGTVPTPLQAFVDTIADDQQRFSANMLLGGATEFRRDHPLVAQFGAGIGKTEAEIDDIWRLGATL